MVFKEKFSSNDYTVYSCPHCNEDSLKVDVEKIITYQTVESKQAENDEVACLNPDEFYHSVFTGTLTCENNYCQGIVTYAGNAYVDIDYSEYPDEKYITYYYPQVFFPHLKYFKIPSNCHREVEYSLNEAFSLTLLSPSSAANKVRASIENLLHFHFNIRSTDDQGVFISLHKRLEDFSKRESELSQIVNAIRWIGNEGSHGISSIKVKDIFEAYEFMQHVLDNIYQPVTSIQNRALSRIENKGRSISVK